MAISCVNFSDFLARKTEHFDNLILKSRRPADDAYIGHHLRGPFAPFEGTTHKFNKFEGAYPDLRGSWQDIPASSATSETCATAPCSPEESEIGWGVTQTEYTLQRRQYRTKALCWEQSMTADWANDQLNAIVSFLRRGRDQIKGNWLKTYAFMNAGTVYFANAAGTSAAVSAVTVPGFAADILKVNGVASIGKLQYRFLQRFIGPLRRDGYFAGENPPAVPMYKLITDDQTAWEMREDNPDLKDRFRFDSFEEGQKMWKYGVSELLGNFMITYDNLPIRYQMGADGVTLYRVYPYTNAPTTIGIKDALEPAYETAPFQLSPIWSDEFVRVMEPEWAPPTAEGMAGAIKPLDYEGKWQFNGNKVLVYKNAEGTQCVIDNKTQQMGMWWARFQMGIRPERPEYVRWILHARRVPCMVDILPCNGATYPTYVTQNSSAANATCPA